MFVNLDKLYFPTSDREGFLRDNGLELAELPGRIAEMLEHAVARKDADELEEACLVACAFEMLPPHYNRLCAELLTQDWHRQHEDLASHLQRAQDPSTVEALYAAAAMPQPDYVCLTEGVRPFARKCVKALAAIGAREKLELLAEHQDPVIRGYARKELDR